MSAQAKGLVAARAFYCLSKCAILHAAAITVAAPAGLPSFQPQPPQRPLQSTAVQKGSSLAAAAPKEEPLPQATFAELNQPGAGPGGPDRLLPPPCLSKRAKAAELEEDTEKAPQLNSCTEAPTGVPEEAEIDEDTSEKMDEETEQTEQPAAIVTRPLPPLATYSKGRLAAAAAKFERLTTQQQHQQQLKKLEQQTLPQKCIEAVTTSAQGRPSFQAPAVAAKPAAASASRKNAGGAAADHATTAAPAETKMNSTIPLATKATSKSNKAAKATAGASLAAASTAAATTAVTACVATPVEAANNPVRHVATKETATAPALAAKAPLVAAPVNVAAGLVTQATAMAAVPGTAESAPKGRTASQASARVETEEQGTVLTQSTKKRGRPLKKPKLQQPLDQSQQQRQQQLLLQQSQNAALSEGLSAACVPPDIPLAAVPTVATDAPKKRGTKPQGAKGSRRGGKGAN